MCVWGVCVVLSIFAMLKWWNENSHFDSLWICNLLCLSKFQVEVEIIISKKGKWNESYKHAVTYHVISHIHVRCWFLQTTKLYYNDANAWYFQMMMLKKLFISLAMHVILWWFTNLFNESMYINTLCACDKVEWKLVVRSLIKYCTHTDKKV